MLEIDYEILKICGNCSFHIPVELDDNSDDVGVCSFNDIFDPHWDEITNNDYSNCRKLIEENLIKTDDEICDKYEQVEFREDEEISHEIIEKLKSGKEMKPKFLKDLLLEIQIDNTQHYLKTKDVIEEKNKLFSGNKDEAKETIESLLAMSCFGNKKAENLLLDYYLQLPPVTTLEECHYKIYLLNKFNCSKNKKFAKCLIDELYKTKSNATSRSLITNIFKYLGYVELEYIAKDLENMLKDKRFSYRLKNKMKYLLYGQFEDDYF